MRTYMHRNVRAYVQTHIHTCTNKHIYRHSISLAAPGMVWKAAADYVLPADVVATFTRASIVLLEDVLARGFLPLRASSTAHEHLYTQPAPAPRTLNSSDPVCTQLRLARLIAAGRKLSSLVHLNMVWKGA